MKQQKFKSKDLKGLPYFGGSYTTTRAHRVARPVSNRRPMHLVLKSSKAVGEYSFLKKQNTRYIEHQLGRLSKKYGIKILQVANVGNHLHLMIKLSNRFTYTPFIRALTGAISLHIMGRRAFLQNGGQGSPLSRLPAVNRGRQASPLRKIKFWDFRPYTRIIVGKRGYLRMSDYININKLEGAGLPRILARFLIHHQKFLGEWRQVLSG